MFQGAKGGGGSFKQTPDNLRSTDTFEGVLGLCVGPIKGPARGLKSIKLDGTPVENETGEMNFADFMAVIGDGDPTKFPQPVQLKLGAGASPLPVNVSITNPNNANDQSQPGPWVTRTLNNTNADFIDIRFVVQQLFRQDKKGIYETTATLEIEMKPTGSTTWINPIGTTPTGTYNPTTGMNIITKGQALVRGFFGPKNFNPDGTWKLGPSGFTLTGKTTGPAVYELRIAVPNEDAYANTQWDVRVRLLERDDHTYGSDNEKAEKRTIAWESMAAVYGSTMGEHEDWRGLAWAQFYGKASDQLTGVPEIEGDYFTKIVSVPPQNVFNPDTRVYSGTIWDGSWSKAYTNDPAWVINDAISDSLSGLSLIAQGSYLNKWDALELSKWCSEPVPDGNGTGGTEPRYSLNIAVTEPQKAEEFVRYLGGAVGALLWDQGDGQWRCKVDKPEPAADIFTLDNIEGEFVYSHTDIDTRHNDIIGKFINQEMDFREDSVRLFDNASIAQIGRKPTTIALVGCTGRQEAMRRVKLRLRATVNEYKIVSFTTNRRGRNIEPLSTILVADGDLGDQDARTTGRILSIDGARTTITVRDPMRLEQGVDYTLKFAKPNPDYSPDRTNQPGVSDWKNPTLVYSRTVTNTSGERGNVTEIKLDAALPADIAEYMVVALEATGLATLPKMFRVTNVIPQDDGERIVINAINIDTGKWDASDNVSKEDLVFQDLRGAPQPPTEIPGRPLLNVVTVPLEQGKQSTLQAAWLRPSGAYIRGFQIQYSLNGGPMQGAIEQQMAEWELALTQPGTYKVEIRTVSRSGQMSVPLIGTLDTEQNLYTAGDIKYDDGQTIEDLKPAEGGATNGMNPSEQALLDQLEQDVIDAEALVSSIQATVNSDLAAVDTALAGLQSDITALETSVAADINALETEIAGINPMATPNLLDNGGFENGLTGWGQTGYTHMPSTPKWGTRVERTSASGAHSLTKDVPVSANNVYTFAADLSLFATTANLTLRIQWLDSGGTQVGSVAIGTAFPVNTDFDVADSRRKTYKVSATAPTGAVTARVNVYLSSSTGLTYLGVRRVKFELGDKATSFTTEASSYTAYQTGVSNTGAIASLTSTVSTLNSTVTTQATSISTLTSGLATLTNTVNASSNPNMLVNGGPENGTVGWGSGSTGATNTLTAQNFGSGGRRYLRATVAAGGTAAFLSIFNNRVTVVAGNAYSLTGDFQLNGTPVTGSSWARWGVAWYNSGGTEISRVMGSPRSGPSFGFDVTGAARATYGIAGAVAPANATSADIFLEAGAVGTGAQWFLDASQVKFERGALNTPYSGEAAVTQAFTAYATLDSELASLSTTVSTQGSSLSTLQTSMTSAQGSIATLTTQMTANGNPNLLPNGGLENGLTGILSAPNFTWAVDAGWGPRVVNTVAGTAVFTFANVTVRPGAVYTLSCDPILFGVASTGYVDMIGFDSGGAQVWDSSQITLTGPFDFNATQDRRRQIANTQTIPANVASVRCRFVANNLAGGTAGFRQMKLEYGSNVTAYTAEASIRSVYTVANTATSSIASLSSTVSTQGASISSLQTAMSTAQGDVATLKTQVRTGGGNLLNNTDFAVGYDGWATSVSSQTGVTFSRDMAGDDWRLPDEHNIGLRQASATASGYSDYRQTFTAESGKWYDFSCLVASHRCNVQVYIQFINSAGAVLQTINTAVTTPGNGGPLYVNWTYLTLKGQAPANTRRAQLYLRKHATTSGTDSYAWWHRPQVVETTEDAAAGVAYSPGSSRATVETIQTSVNGVLAQWVLNLDVNGYVSGMKLANNGSASSLVFRADLVQFLKPGGGASLTWSGGAIIVDDGT